MIGATTTLNVKSRRFLSSETEPTPSSVYPKRQLFPKPVLDLPLLLEAIDYHGINRKHAQTVLRYVCQKDITSFTEIPKIPKALTQLLENEFTLSTSRIVTSTNSADGSTTKLLIELQDGKKIESVVMRYGDVELQMFPEEEKKRNENGELVFKSTKRATLCVSSQVGCAMACTFCATGTMGLLSNLTAGEILEQLQHANKITKIRNVVFMGMGEPLDNYPAVIEAAKAMSSVSQFGLSPARISISTVGVVNRIYNLIRDVPQIGLALSLHAPNQKLREQIVPTAKAWKIERILEACDAFINNQNAGVNQMETMSNGSSTTNITNTSDGKTNMYGQGGTSRSKPRHVMVEYVLISEVNDTPEVAHELGQLLQNRCVILNLIPYNPTSVNFDYKPPTKEAKKVFLEIVRSYGVTTLIRQTLGQDKNSACGQLVVGNGGQPSCSNDNDKNGDGKKTDVVDMEDLGGVARVDNVEIRKRKTRASPTTASSVETMKQSTGKEANIEKALVIILLSLVVLLIARWYWRQS